MKLLMMSVGGQRYAVAAEAVEQITDPALDADFRRETGSAEAIHHGVRYRVVELHEAADRPGGSRLYLLLGDGPSRAMLPVDSAEAIREVPGTAIAPLPPFIFSGERRLFRGIFFDGREPRLLLDVGAIL